jgi:hypothetical protein
VATAKGAGALGDARHGSRKARNDRDAEAQSHKKGEQTTHLSTPFCRVQATNARPGPVTPPATKRDSLSLGSGSGAPKIDQWRARGERKSPLGGDRAPNAHLERGCGCRRVSLPIEPGGDDRGSRHPNTWEAASATRPISNE